ncbi:MAG: metal ABC transporter substrate-binding protein [Anaerolineae bacterium]|nr:metal ABC transporter substrate-binding protein [Anaerolineae bacterium]MDW8100162.1 metal ABC transporter substrate-binding protein [Anaerolineae bacterium]
MTRLWILRGLLVALGLAVLAGCVVPTPSPVAPVSGQPGLQVLAVTTFLADIAQNVAGDRLTVASLIPIGLDPHAFEPTPQDVARIAASQVLIVNGAGFEGWLERVLKNVDGERLVITASAGLAMREPGASEIAHEHEHERDGHSGEATPEPAQEEEYAHHHREGDPHFWLDPVLVIKYVENIRDGLSQADPAGKAVYVANAAAYIAELNELHQWILAQVATIPPERRLLVTNHESFGYFADRYGFTIVGTVIPSVSTGASPSAQEMAALIERIKETGAPAIFLETGGNPRLARQIAQEAGVKVVTELFTHSITDASGPAPTYIEMMRYNVRTIVDALQ